MPKETPGIGMQQEKLDFGPSQKKPAPKRGISRDVAKRRYEKASQEASMYATTLQTGEGIV